MTAQPQDRKPSAKEMMSSALKLQSATMTQKATLDHVAGKLIMIVGVLQRHKAGTAQAEADANLSTDYWQTMENHADSALREVAEITRMTRSQVNERLANKAFEYPDVAIQKIINEASEDIAALLIPKGDVE